MITYIYWIHYPHHNDPLTQGYIGISINPRRRYAYHSDLNCTDNLIVTRAIKKGAIQTILHEFNSREEAYLTEVYYRPTERIGWNIIPGGVAPPSQKGLKNRFVSQSNKTRIVSETTRTKMSRKRIGTSWFNNGIVNKRCGSPPEGFVPGRLPFTRAKIKDTSKMGRPKIVHNIE